LAVATSDRTCAGELFGEVLAMNWSPLLPVTTKSSIRCHDVQYICEHHNRAVRHHSGQSRKQRTRQSRCAGDRAGAKGLDPPARRANLIALSGDTARFLAGGEFPVPVPSTTSSGAPTVTIDYKKFGVELGFTPTVLSQASSTCGSSRRSANPISPTPSSFKTPWFRPSRCAIPAPRLNCATVRVSPLPVFCKRRTRVLFRKYRGSAQCRCWARCFVAPIISSRRPISSYHNAAPGCSRDSGSAAGVTA
jgi:hypothetical protein